MNRRLYRSPDDRVLAGVAGGMAETYDFDPALVRMGWALLILFTGGVFLIV
ncbi:MAG TPA: PspC domain-containing protein [Candidatus Limnocylindria bacterium]|nr:PspC domain-containing protein [Candidatus Limnocylindria bacterium]